MKTRFYYSGFAVLIIFLLLPFQNKVYAQRGGTIWANDGYQYYKINGGGIDELDARDVNKKTTIVTKEMLTPQGKAPLAIKGFSFSADGNKVLIFTNTKRVWRYNTRGDYWVYDIAAKTLKQQI